MGILFEWVKYPMSLKTWMAFIILFPFYFFRSGLPQIADIVLALLIISELTSNRGPTSARFNHILSPLKMFAAYVVVVGLAWMPFIQAPQNRTYLLFIFPMFYVYNALAFWVALRLYSRFGGQFLRGSLIAVTLSVLTQFLLMPVAPSGGETRGDLFFNNPNQLGYFSLLALTIFLYLERFTATSVVVKSLFFAGTSIFAATANSKAALVSSVILISVNLIETGVVRVKHFLGGLVAVAFVAGIIINTDMGGDFFDKAIARVSEIGSDNDDNMEMRGYDRIWNHPEYTVLGAGEGGWDRFYRDPKKRYEMHSTFGTILFSYGLPGSLLFFIFVYRVFRGSSILSFMYSLPIFAYGLTHMGLRFTLFWVFFAIVATARDYDRLQETATRAPRPQMRPQGLPHPKKLQGSRV